MTKIKLSVLSEHRKGDNACDTEVGLSLYFEINSNKFLFDTGASDLFIKNAKVLGINLDEVKIVALSHGHWDHGNGLRHLENKTIVLHPESFVDRYSVIPSRAMQYAGLNQKLDEISSKSRVIQTREPYELFENVYYLGQIPRTIDFEGDGNLSTILNLHTKEIDHVLDDSGIVIKTDNGIIITSGCAHSGICNTIEYSKKVVNDNRILAVIGGFHLREMDERAIKTLNYFSLNNIQALYMGHCNSHKIMEEFEKQLYGKTTVKRLFSGAEFEI